MRYEVIIYSIYLGTIVVSSLPIRLYGGLVFKTMIRDVSLIFHSLSFFIKVN